MPEAIAKMITTYKIADPRLLMKGVMAELLTLPQMDICTLDEDGGVQFVACPNRTWHFQRDDEKYRICSWCQKYDGEYMGDRRDPWYLRTKYPFTPYQVYRSARKHYRYRQRAMRLKFKRQNPHIKLPKPSEHEELVYVNKNLAVVMFKRLYPPVVIVRQCFGSVAVEYRRQVAMGKRAVAAWFSDDAAH